MDAHNLKGVHIDRSPDANTRTVSHNSYQQQPQQQLTAQSPPQSPNPQSPQSPLTPQQQQTAGGEQNKRDSTTPAWPSSQVEMQPQRQED